MQWWGVPRSRSGRGRKVGPGRHVTGGSGNRKDHRHADAGCVLGVERASDGLREAADKRLDLGTAAAVPRPRNPPDAARSTTEN